MRSYSSIYSLGHRAAQDILRGPVVVQEKIDGSQFSFQMTITEGTDGATLHMRSKGAEVFSDTKDKLFKPAVDTAVRLFGEGKLVAGWTYRGEVIAKPKHNTLAYDRVPAGNIILFDIDMGEESYTLPDFVASRAAELGLEVVPTLYEGIVESLDQLRAFLDRVSVLGGAKIEGVVIKAYGTYGIDKKTLMAKYVSEQFKEIHAGDWKERNPGRQDVVLGLIEKYKTPARWQKAVQHLRERGVLQEAPQDIGALMVEVQNDVFTEEHGEIAAALMDHFWPQIKRGITGGLPMWYKDELAKAAFEPATMADLADPRPASYMAVYGAEDTAEQARAEAAQDFLS